MDFSNLHKGYPGDEKFAELLKGLGSPLSFEEVRAYLMGAVSSTNHPPSQILHDHILGDKGVFENDAQIKQFMEGFMGLWNELAKLQDPGRRFEFAPRKIRPDLSAMTEMLRLRKAEILQFIKGLDAGGTDPREFSGEDQSAFKYLAEGDAIFEGVLNLIAKKPKETPGQVQELVKNLEQVEEAMTDCIHRIVLAAKKVRIAKLEAFEEKETLRDAHRHVGRNDPCPCGSGIKFKKCCLSKLQ